MRTYTFILFIALIITGNISGLAQTRTDRFLVADSSFLDLIKAEAKLEILDSTFQFTEGPVWNKHGFLLFSDIPGNKIIKWSEKEDFSDFLNPSDHTNGLTFDHKGELIMCSHGARSVLRLKKDGQIEVIADRFKGKRLNSPNDLVISSSGNLYFTDPCWGLNAQEQSPDKELPYNGVYLIHNDSLILIDSTLWRPNGIVLSPDQKLLYVSDMFTDNSDEVKTIYRYHLDSNGIPTDRELLIVSNPPHQILGRINGFDGLKADIKGNIYCTGPHGIVVLNPDGKYLGTITTPLAPANCAWGDDDFQTLYITARRHLYRIPLNIKGFSPK
jgi:gluconolactonase